MSPHLPACLQDAVARAQVQAGPGVDASARARDLAQQRLRQRGWLREEDGALLATNQMAWLLTAQKDSP